MDTYFGFWDTVKAPKAGLPLWLEKLENTLFFEKKLEKLENDNFLLDQQLEKLENFFNHGEVFQLYLM